MSVLPNQLWGEAQAYTWGELNRHEWLDFRLALAEAESEMIGQGVKVVSSGTSAIALAEATAQGVKLVFSKAINDTATEMVSSIVVSNRDYVSHMLKYLPLYERKSAIYKAILKSSDREFRNVEQLQTIVERNMFIHTAIEHLSLYERDLAIKQQLNLKYDQRREQITARTRAAFDQTTIATMKNVASAFSNGEVDIHPTEIDGVFECEFVGTVGIPNNMDGLKEAIELIIPAHLEMTYKYSFQVWDNWNSKQWASVKTLTWEELRTKGEV